MITGSLGRLQDSIFIKEPGDGISHWHRDQAVAPLDTGKQLPTRSVHTIPAGFAATDKFITLWIPLHEAPPESGTLFFASGSQFDSAAMVSGCGASGSHLSARNGCCRLLTKTSGACMTWRGRTTCSWGM